MLDLLPINSRCPSRQMGTGISADWRIDRALLRFASSADVKYTTTAAGEQYRWAERTRMRRGWRHVFTKSSLKQSPMCVADRAIANMNSWASQCMHSQFTVSCTWQREKDPVNGSTARKQKNLARQGQVRYNIHKRDGRKCTVPPSMLKRDWPPPNVETKGDVKESSE